MATLSIEEFADRVSDAMRFMVKEFMRQQSGGFYKIKVTMPQFVILDLLQRLGETKMSDLARSGGVTTAAMTGLIDRLVRGGYAARKRDGKDRRIVRVTATAKGRRIVKDAMEHRREIIIRTFGNLSRHDRDEYLRILTLIKGQVK